MSSSKKKIYVGSVGTQIIVDAELDISGATARSFDVKKPDGSTVSWPAVAEGTTKLRFDTLPGTLDQPGTWKLQAHVILPGGEWPGATAEFEVYSPFG